MGRARRNRNPALYRLITIRTLEARMWMIPTRKMEKLLGGIVARYASFAGIELYAYCFLSNHYHLVIRAPRGNTDEFCENINREIARRVNWKNHRTGTFWHTPYADQRILSESDLVEAFLYVTTNAVRHGLVEHPELWTGLCSYSQCLYERDRSFTFHHYTAQDPDKIVCSHTLKLSVLPMLRDLRKQERQERISALIEERVKELHAYRKSNGLGFLGLEGVLSIIPGSIPQTVSRSPRPVSYTKDAELRKQAKAEARERNSKYSEASFRYRLGDLQAEFPEFAFRPPLHCKPRHKPFEELSESYILNAA